MTKLVRDKIPDLFPGGQYHTADDAEFRQRLIDKVKEEVQEFEEIPCLEEAADIYEVFMAMIRAHNMFLSDVIFEPHKKKLSRGGFNKKAVWVKE